jgi:hypothetical protein
MLKQKILFEIQFNTKQANPAVAICLVTCKCKDKIVSVYVT